MLRFEPRHSLYVVRGSSMKPSLLDGDILVVRKLNRKLRRGDVVVVDLPSSSDTRWQVKRVVGLPDDQVSFEDGLLHVNGKHLREPYLFGLPADLGANSRSWRVGPDECMVLGDNRAHSTDSREFGPVPLASLAGIAVVRLWPLIGRRPIRLR